VSLGIAGGLMPCTDALAILIAAVNLRSVAAGMVLIVAFSVGMAAVLVAIGILMVKARGFMERFTGESRCMKAVPVASGAALFLLGAWLTFQSLTHAGILRPG
jgi:ABC-type nickel/cobalt efflux system permease component RcnA